MNDSLAALSSHQLKQAVVIREQIDVLEQQLGQILNGSEILPTTKAGKRKMSASARAKIGAAQRARWAKAKGETVKPERKAKRKMSAAGRAAISAAAKKRWKKAKAAGKKTL